MSERDARDKLRIGAVEEKTGLSRDTIHHYVREGLLHPPQKISATVAYFDRTHVQRLRAIRALRAASLPLATVKRLLATPSIAALSLEQLERLGRSIAAAGLRESPRASRSSDAGRAFAARLRLADRVDEDPALAEALSACAEALSAAQLDAIEQLVWPAMRALALQEAESDPSETELDATGARCARLLSALLTTARAEALSARAIATRRVQRKTSSK